MRIALRSSCGSCPSDIADPVRMIQIPANGLPDAGLERLGWSPAQLCFDLTRVDRIAPVVARAIGHECDLFLIGAAIGFWPKFVKHVAEHHHDLKIRPLVPAADIVGLPRQACIQHPPNSAAVILYIEPVANLPPIAVERQFPT